jgi:biotin--protein ligase
MQYTRGLTFGLLLAGLLCSGNCSSDAPELPSIALYSDQGVDEDCLRATRNMLEWTGYRVAQIEAPAINEGDLDAYQALCVPGGNMYSYAEDISAAGKDNIRDFIERGGGYVGICGGAYFAASDVVWRGTQLPMTPLGLYSGTAVGPIKEIFLYPEYGMCQVNLVETEHPITRSEPDSVWVLYYWGPALNPVPEAPVDVLGTYDIGGRPAMLAFDYGRGRVFLTGVHPEIEEDCDRDGVTLGDELDDHGSDWGLLANAVRWCLRE